VVDRLLAALSNRCRLDRELGAGGTATVYLAHDLKHDRDAALKVLHPALGGARFLTGIRTPARLQHPPTCRCWAAVRPTACCTTCRSFAAMPTAT
jgi:serine/threonine protein kinase